MAIVSLDGVINALPGQYIALSKASLTGAAGNIISLWTAAGLPAAGSSPGSAGGSAPTSSTTGACTFTNPGAGNSYIGKASMSLAQAGTLIVYDRLVHTSTLSGTNTGSQTVNSAAITRPDANGAGVECWVECYTQLGSTSRTLTVTYTDQDGNGSASGSATIPSTMKAGQMVPMSFAAGDTGVRSVQSVQLSGSTLTAGDFGITLLRRLAEIPINVANAGMYMDVFDIGMPRVYDSACIAFMVVCSAASTGQLLGSLNIIQG